MQALKKLIPFVANRYFIACLAFILWMLFFDQRNFFLQRDRAAELEKLEQAKEIIAKELNYKDWETCINDQPNYKIEGIMDKVAERYNIKRILR